MRAVYYDHWRPVFLWWPRRYQWRTYWGWTERRIVNGRKEYRELDLDNYL